jgi:rare lipoprotein A (peptidoglycan hydrolase)
VGRRAVLAFLALCLAASGALGQKAATPKAAAPKAAVLAPSEAEGTASWYGPGFHGKRTASGEVYDEEGLTAAHRTLPFGTYLRVSSLDDGSSVVVRINDRGPFAKGRIVDLSQAAARIIGMIPSGTARVRLEVIPEEEALAWKGGTPDGSPAASRGAAGGGAGTALSRSTAAERVRIQVGSYASEANAQATVRRLSLSGLEATIEKAGAVNRVVIAGLSVEASRQVSLKLDGLGYRGYLVIAEKP